MRPLFVALLCSASTLLAAVSQPVSAAAAKQDAAAATHPKKRHANPKFMPGSSQESPRERERRLLRECKGRPNAGACAGYAS